MCTYNVSTRVHICTRIKTALKYPFLLAVPSVIAADGGIRRHFCEDKNFKDSPRS